MNFGRAMRRPNFFLPAAFAALILVAALALALNSPQPGRSSTSSSAVTTSTQSEKSSTSGAVSLVMSLGLTPRLLGPGTTINYTLSVFGSGNLSSPLMLGFSAPPGFELTFNPKSITATSNQAVDVGVHLGSTVPPGDYTVRIQATGSAGSFSTPFIFRVVQHLVIAWGISGFPTGFIPANITVKAGTTVTWLSLDGGTDDYPGAHYVNFKALNVTSPLLHQFDKWSYTFTSAGTFAYTDPINYPLAGTITVEP